MEAIGLKGQSKLKVTLEDDKITLVPPEETAAAADNAKTDTQP